MYSKGPVTNDKTQRTAKTADAMIKRAKTGNITGTRLPKGGCPKGVRKSSRKGMSY